MPGTGPTAKPGAIPPGPANPIRTTMAFQRRVLDFVGEMIDTYGDISSFRLGPYRCVLLRHPRHVKHILQRNPANFDRSAFPFKLAKAMFGRGLTNVAGGEEWRDMRRMLQPSFHHQRIASMAEHMLSVIRTRLAHWDTAARSGEILDAGVEMRRLTLHVVARSLFALDEQGLINRFAEAIDTMDQEIVAYVRMPLLPLSVPTAGHRRFWAAHAIVEEMIDYLITQHLTDQVDRGDLLSMMIQAEDSTGARLTDVQLRDQVFAMLFAGHETGANVLTWLWYLLGMHPEVQLRVRQEIDAELAGLAPTLADCTRLTYTRQVIDETQRLYPQQYQGWRRALADDEIDGYRIPAGSDVFYSTYHVHRHPDFWDAPDEFRPERFAAEEVAKRDRTAYLPFGSGPHRCIGEQFAMTEMLFIVASTMQRYRVELADPKPVAPKALITLGPEQPIRVRLIPRG
jgi:cytochrome P450